VEVNVYDYFKNGGLPLEVLFFDLEKEELYTFRKQKYYAKIMFEERVPSG